MDSLNNMKKTVLKLENEISAIDLNLTKVRKKGHSKMKSIIQNINNLLSKEEKKNNIDLDKLNNYIYNIKRKEKEESKRNKNNNKYIHTKNKNIDCIFISFKNPKGKNKPELNLNDETFFNKNGKTSSQIYKNKSNIYHFTTNGNLLKNKENDFENNKINNLTNKLNIKCINKSRNLNNLFYDHMTYTKPKLNNEFSRNNINKKRNKTNSSKQIIKNIPDINNKIDSLIPIGGRNNSVYKIKNLSSKRIKKENEIKSINKNSHQYNFINNIYSDNRKKGEENLFKKELLFNKKVLSIDELETKENFDNYKNNNEQFPFSGNDFSIKKTKNLIFDLKPELNNTFNFNQNTIQVPKTSKNILTKTYKNNFNNLNKKYSRNNPYLIIDENNKNYIKSFAAFNNKIDNEDLIIEKNHFYKNNITNLKKKNNSRDDKSKKDNEIEMNNIKLNKLLRILKANNIDEAISEVAKIIKLRKYIQKCKIIYDEDNSLSNDSINRGENNKNLHWLNDMIKNYRENKIYKNFCESIMVNNKIKHFDDFKKFINSILINNKKNNGFLVEVKNILLDERYHENKKKGKSVNNINCQRNIRNKNNNKVFHDLENSNDIKYSRNDDNFEKHDNWRKTYY